MIANKIPFPFMPYFFPTLSADIPPRALAKIFMKPNVPAQKPADAWFNLKVSVKCKAATPSKVISIPKQTAYAMANDQKRQSESMFHSVLVDAFFKRFIVS